MIPLKIFHAADIHYCPRHLKWVDRAFTAAVDKAIADRCDLFIIAGDSFDASLGAHEPSLHAYIKQINRLLDHMSGLVLQGTFSHDKPGTLNLLRALRGRHEIFVADRPDRVYLFKRTDGYTFEGVKEDTYGHAVIGYRGSNDQDQDCNSFSREAVEKFYEEFPGELKDEARATLEPVLAICVMPSLNKGDPEVMQAGAREWVWHYFEKWSIENIKDRSRGISSILVTHGEVVGGRTESDYAMVSPDHEFHLDDLAASEVNAVMLGHLHPEQSWERTTVRGNQVRIAYCGSTAKLVHGHRQPTGILIWDFISSQTMPTATFHPMPSRVMIEIEFPNEPIIEELEELAAKATDEMHFLIQYTVDVEHASSVDKQQIKEIFKHAGGLKIRPTLNAIESVRAPEIAKKRTLGEGIDVWAKTAEVQDKSVALQDRAELADTVDDPREIVRLTTDAIDLRVEEGRPEK